MRLLSVKIINYNVVQYVLDDDILTDTTKSLIVEYCEDDSVHSILNITFEELLMVVWNRVTNNDNKDEIKKILNTEMKDSECKCFTGRISRLVNCLNGFDQLVEIKISDNEQIGNVISQVETKLRSQGKYTVELHRQEATQQLRELNVEETEITTWLSYIE